MEWLRCDLARRWDQCVATLVHSHTVNQSRAMPVTTSSFPQWTSHVESGLKHFAEAGHGPSVSTPTDAG